MSKILVTMHVTHFTARSFLNNLKIDVERISEMRGKGSKSLNYLIVGAKK